ncbi:MAG: MFS transporter [Methanomassiliicoccus sp.]|nr:MFS transporter [Methanomassiliicoccus sp.]
MEAGEARRRQGARIAAILFVTVLAAYLARVSISVALPFIAEDFAWTEEQTGALGGLLLGVFLLGYGLANVLISPLADCYGPKKGLLLAVLSWSVVTLLMGVVGMIYAAFVLLRTTLGMAQGVVFPSAGKITQAWTPPERRSRMNAMYYSAIALANILSPLLLIPLMMAASWNIMFIALGATGFVLLAPILLWLRDSPEGPPDCEKKTLKANLDLVSVNLREAVRIRGLFLLTLAHSLWSIAFWGLALWLPTFLIMARGFSADELVWAAAVPYVGYIAGLFAGSYLSDRTGRRSLVTASFLMAGAVMMVSLLLLPGREETIVALTVLFFFIAILGPNVATLLQGCCVSRLTCSATGIENGLSNGLGALGPVAVGAIVAVTGSYDAALPLLALLFALSGVAIFRFKGREAETCPVPGPRERLS